MTFLAVLTPPAYQQQPTEPATVPCCGRPAVGWAWTGRSWWSACAQDMPTLPANAIWNTEFLEDL